jgi:hypothetical protein
LAENRAESGLDGVLIGWGRLTPEQRNSRRLARRDERRETEENNNELAGSGFHYFGVNRAREKTFV